MLNQAVVVGRLISDPQIEEKEGIKVCYVSIACPRAFKNEEGENDIDNIPVVLKTGVAENTAEYCHQGDLLGVKGRLECNDDKLQLIAEKVTFLSTKNDK